MEKETKFNIGDSVWVMYKNKAYNGEIVKIMYYKHISLITYNNEEMEKYNISGLSDSFTIDKIFSTKEDLINSL